MGGGGRGVFLSPSTSFLGKCPWRKVAIRGGTTHHTRGHFSSHYCSSAPIQPHLWLHMDTYCLRGILYVFSNDTLPYIYGSWLPCHVWRNPVRFESQGIQEFQSVNRSIIYIYRCWKWLMMTVMAMLIRSVGSDHGWLGGQCNHPRRCGAIWRAIRAYQPLSVPSILRRGDADHHHHGDHHHHHHHHYMESYQQLSAPLNMIMTTVIMMIWLL